MKTNTKLYQRLNSPAKIQDYLNTLRINFEEEGDTCMSPSQVLETQQAHCMEGAMLAASILRFHGYPPLVMDIRANLPDFDHVVAVFKINGHFGAISKTNHAVLRYREPVYKNIRELALSYFHEYFTDDGKKTVKDYSQPVNLSRFDHIEWETTEEQLWEIPEYLDRVKHYSILPKELNKLRRADPIEIKAGQITEYKP